MILFYYINNNFNTLLYFIFTFYYSSNNIDFTKLFQIALINRVYILSFSFVTPFFLNMLNIPI